jgi:hypothetical protein
MRKAIVALFIFAACGGGGGGWDEQARADFIAGCQDGGGTAEQCKCVQEKTEERHPDMTADDQLPASEATEIAKECFTRQ